MITSVNTILVAQRCTTTGTEAADWKIGDLAMFDENKKFITTADAAAKAGAIYLGVVTDSVDVTEPTGDVKKMPVFKYSSAIQKSGHPRATIVDYSAPKEDEIKIKFGESGIVAGHRYVLRIVYKDINEAPGQFTHTYEVYASDNTADTVGKALADKVMKHKNRRVAAKWEDAETKTLTLTALERDDNDGLDSLSEYAQVSMEATLYETIPGALLANQPKAVEGVTITKTPGTPGRGNWKIVRDEEKRYMGYTGHVFTGAYPAIEQKLLTEEGGEYDTLTIECDNLYLSNDNQYIKTTPITTTVYALKKNAEDGLTKATFKSMVEAFISGEAAGE